MGDVIRLYRCECGARARRCGCPLVPGHPCWQHRQDVFFCPDCQDYVENMTEDGLCDALRCCRTGLFVWDCIAMWPVVKDLLDEIGE